MVDLKGFLDSDFADRLDLRDVLEKELLKVFLQSGIRI